MNNVIHVDFGARQAPTSDARSMINLANQMARRAKHKEAVPLYRKACRVEPERWEAHYNLGLCLYEMLDFSGAISSFERALRLAPNSAEVRINLARALCGAGRASEAARHWRRYLELEPSGQWAAVVRQRLAQNQAI